MSSRLLTMKFMQRAAAAGSAASTPASDSSSAKRRKFDSPLTGDFHSFNEAAIQAALSQQEATRQAALAKHGAELGDTQWVLDDSWLKPEAPAAEAPRKIEYLSMAQIDALNGDDDDEEDVLGGDQPGIGRRRVGDYKPADAKVGPSSFYQTCVFTF